MGRKLHVYTFLLIQIVTLYFSQAVHAADAATLVRQLPRSYAGQFQWRRGAGIHKVTIKFTDVRVLDTGLVEATGTSVYDVYGEIHNVNVRAVISPGDLFLEMWEYEKASDDLEVEGLYRGDLSADMQTITALWTNFSDKRRGNLRLVANP
jgi:hypothetical protein